MCVTVRQKGLCDCLNNLCRIYRLFIGLRVLGKVLSVLLMAAVTLKLRPDQSRAAKCRSERGDI